MTEHPEYPNRTQVVIPGVGGVSAAQILVPPAVTLVAGDSDAGFYRRGAPFDRRDTPEHGRGAGAGDGTASPVRVEAYCWAGLTSRDWTRALWLLLLPFMLANIGYWTAPAVVTEPAGPEEGRAGPEPGRADPRGWQRVMQRSAEALQRLLALSLTVGCVLAAVAVSMDLLGTQCVADGRSCTPALAFLSWPWLDDTRRLVLTSAAPTALVLLLWWLGNRTWQQLESVPVPAAPPTGVRTPLEDRRMWNGRRSVRMLRAVHVTAAFAVIAAFLAAGTLAAPDRGLAAWAAAQEWHRPRGWPVVTVLLASLVLIAGTLVAAALPVAGRRDRPGTGTGSADRPLPLEEHLFRWLPRIGLALVVLAAAAALAAGRPSAARAASGPASSAALPWLSGAITALFVGQVVATAVLAACCWAAAHPAATRPVAAHPVDRPVWWGLAPAVAAGLAWLLQDGLAAGVTLLAADRLGTPGPPAGTVTGQRFVVAPAVLWAAVTAVGVACVLLAATGAVLLSGAPDPAMVTRVRQAYRFQHLDSAPPGSPRQQRAESIARDWSRGRLADRLARHGGLLAAVVALVVAAGAAADLTMPPALFAASWRWPVTIGSWLLGGLVLVLFYVGRQAYASPAWRRTVGVLWDIGTFWPRAVHPLGPPCYAERAVPDLINRLTYLTGTGEPADGREPDGRDPAGAGTASGPPPHTGQVLLSGHSQGSVLAAVTVMQLSEETARHVRLLTYGSPLRRLYARFFPAYFGDYPLHRLSGFLGAEPGTATGAARWRNLHRPSDPIGGHVFHQFWPSEWPDVTQQHRAVQEQLVHHVDCALLDPSFERAPGDSRYPPTYGHFDYPDDPAFAQATAWLWHGAAVPATPATPAAPTGRTAGTAPEPGPSSSPA
ncbi:hypothetical protein ACNTMW_00615 [Planosporangium sp. 12N6]|uniref:hypothetical protein n=1 Tax=Planosporangium spinosum TaxID=3402278 RepID=UPI003CF113DE